MIRRNSVSIDFTKILRKNKNTITEYFEFRNDSGSSNNQNKMIGDKFY